MDVRGNRNTDHPIVSWSDTSIEGSSKESFLVVLVVFVCVDVFSGVLKHTTVHLFAQCSSFYGKASHAGASADRALAESIAGLVHKLSHSVYGSKGRRGCGRWILQSHQQAIPTSVGAYQRITNLVHTPKI